MSDHIAEIRLSRSGTETDLGGLPPEKVRYLRVYSGKKRADLSFLETAAGLKKLYLCSLPAVEDLPDFGRLPNLYGLKLYERHKLSGIESLARSAIRYLAVSLSADKLSGTKIVEILLGMERLELADLSNLDRSGFRRYGVLENRLKKADREDLLRGTLDMRRWTQL